LSLVVVVPQAFKFLGQFVLAHLEGGFRLFAFSSTCRTPSSGQTVAIRFCAQRRSGPAGKTRMHPGNIRFHNQIHISLDRVKFIKADGRRKPTPNCSLPLLPEKGVVMDGDAVIQPQRGPRWGMLM